MLRIKFMTTNETNYPNNKCSWWWQPAGEAQRESGRERECKIVRYFLAKRRDINQGSNEPTDYESRLETSCRHLRRYRCLLIAITNTIWQQSNTSKLKACLRRAAHLTKLTIQLLQFGRLASERQTEGFSFFWFSFLRARSASDRCNLSSSILLLAEQKNVAAVGRKNH